MEPLTYEEARVRLAVQEELAYARDLLSSVRPAPAESMGHAVVRRIIARFDIRARIEDTAVEVELIRRAKDGDEDAYFRVMFGYAELLRGFAARARIAYDVSDNSDDNVIEAVTVAFARALGKYDPARHAKLTAMLGTHGNNELCRAINPTTRDLGRSADIYTIRQYYSIVTEARAEYAAVVGRDRDAVELAECLDAAHRIAAERYAADPKHALSVRAFDALRDTLETPDVRLDDTYTNDDGDDLTYHDLYAAPARFMPNPEDAAVARALAAQAMAVLDERELEVVRYAYGFPPESYDKMSNGEVAEELKDTRGYSVSTVRRIHKSALKKMRAELGVELEGEE